MFTNSRHLINVLEFVVKYKTMSDTTLNRSLNIPESQIENGVAAAKEALREMFNELPDLIDAIKLNGIEDIAQTPNIVKLAGMKRAFEIVAGENTAAELEDGLNRISDKVLDQVAEN